MNDRRLTRAALALPILLVLAGIVRAELTRATQPTWRLPIAGYDPRDLLRGHYLRFRFVSDDPLGRVESDICACLDRDSERHGKHMTCDRAQTECDDRLDADQLRDAQRFYVDESRARELEQRLIESARRGTAFVEFVLDSQRQLSMISLDLDGERVDAIAPD